MLKLLLTAAAFVTTGAYAANLNTPLPASLWVASDHDTQAAVGPSVGSTAVSNPTWAVLQWFADPLGYTINGMPNGTRLQYLSASGGWNNYIHNEFAGTDSKWRLSNGAVNISYDAVTQPWLNGVYTISQNGSILNTPCGSEYDLFLSPKGPLNSLGANASAAPNGFTATGPISGLTSLILHAGIKVTHENIQRKCINSDHDKVAYGLGIFLRNTYNNTTFFYQLNFRDSRGTPSGGYYEGFQDVYGNSGVGDSILNVAPSSTPLVPGAARVAYSALNLLPRLTQILSQGWAYNGASSNKIYFDSNLSHWKIDGMFVGQYLWGGVGAGSEWDNVFLQAYP